MTNFKRPWEEDVKLEGEIPDTEVEGKDDTGRMEEVQGEPEPSSETAGASSLNSTGENGRFRVRIDNMNSYANSKEILKLCKKLEINNVENCKKAPKWEYAFLMFKTEEDRTDAIKKLNGQEYKKKILEVTHANEVQRAGMQGMQGRAQRDVAADGKDDGRTPAERLADQITPLWKISYEDQLKKKRNEMRKAMVQFREALTRYFPKRFDWKNATPPPADAPILGTEDSEAKAVRQLTWLGPACGSNKEKLPCELLEVIPSPAVDNYRNKCEFTFGWNTAGEKVAGFLCGSFKDGVMTIIEANVAKNVSPAGAEIAKSLTQFLRDSPLEIYDRIAKTGFWRMALVRTHRTGENMVVMQYNPTGVDTETIAAAHDALRAHFEPKKDEAGGVTTLLAQVHDGSFNGLPEDAPLHIIYGPGVVYETLLGLRFRISPTAFFQVNTEATEVLYSKVREWCALDEVTAERSQKVLKAIPEGRMPTKPVTAAVPAATLVSEGVDAATVDAVAAEGAAAAAPTDDGDKAAIVEVLPTEPIPPHPKDLSPPGTILLDLCCGTGTIGLTMAPHVKKVIGVDMIKLAITDAKHNVELNGGDPEGKIIYYADKVEKVIREIVHEHVGVNDDVVVVLDPPRSGVYYDVIRTIRACEAVKRVIYVACAANQAVGNFVDLCRPTSNKFKGDPFKPLRAQPLDLFPHTEHCELVVEFRR
ncbi:S-adenosyl-L-methionine-dependent methyltransferase [Powellomyces hirtus]|nr:S-adenosyl-L-methionine-dependent methyltransferase [Powellomyces hirtus]